MKTPRRIDLSTPLQKKAEAGLQSLGRKARNLPTSAGTGYYRSLTVGETADKIKRVIKRTIRK